MSAVVADTHALIWYLLDPAKLSQDAQAVLMRGDSIYVSAISLVGMRYLVEKEDDNGRCLAIHNRVVK